MSCGSDGNKLRLTEQNAKDVVTDPALLLHSYSLSQTPLFTWFTYKEP